MSRVINFDKGSKRRMKQIRWRRHEIASAILLVLATMTLCVLIEQCDISHYRFEHAPRTPEVKKAIT